MRVAITRTTSMSLTAAVVLAAGLLGGCSSHRSDASSSTPGSSGHSTASTPSRAARVSAESAALAAYRGMWHAFVHASHTSNPQDPQLPRYTSGNALKIITADLSKSRRSHQIGKGNVALHPTVTGARPASAPTEVEIRDCLDDSNWLEYKESGGLVDDVPGGKHRVEAVVTSKSGTWTVTAFALHGVGTCT